MSSVVRRFLRLFQLTRTVNSIRSKKRTLWASSGIASIVLAVVLSRSGLDIKALEKIATHLAMPCGLVWILLTGVAGLSVARRQWLMSFLLMVTWVLYSLAGNGLVAKRLSTTLEGPYMGIRPLSEAPFDVVVVLGGGGQYGANGRTQGGDRLVLAAQLYHRGLTKKLICTGSLIQSMQAHAQQPSAISANVLQGLGVPASAIEQLSGRNTSEEMHSLGERFPDSSQRIGLITSAWHLKRAMRLAHRNQFRPHPLPSDFLFEPAGPIELGERLKRCIPNGEAFQDTHMIAKEYLGMAVGR